MRGYFTLLAAFSVLLLVGCASQPYKPYFSKALKQVPVNELHDYWTLNRSSFHPPGPVPGDGGCIKVRVTIDSNGRVVDPVTIKMYAKPSFENWIRVFLSRLRYEPASGNLDRTPVQTAIVWTFFSMTSINSVPHPDMEKLKARGRVCEGALAD